MKKFTLTHEINCGQERFWELFFDTEFNVALFKKGLGFPEFDVLSFDKADDGTVKRKVRGRPKMNAPAAVQKLLGDSFSYEETGTFDPKTQVWKWEMIPSTLASKLRNEGTVKVESAGEGKVRRVATIEVEAKVFGVGGLLESTTEKEMRNGWDRSAEFFNNWIRDHA